MTEQRLLQRNSDPTEPHRSFLVGNLDIPNRNHEAESVRLQSMRNIEVAQSNQRLTSKLSETTTPTHRLLTSTYEQQQNILKQSSEDCRRLLQQSTTVGPESHKSGNDGTRLLTSSSFDSKCAIDGGRNSSNPDQNIIANFLQNSASATNFNIEAVKLPTSTTFTMCSEAAKLMNTLQQSPLPLKGTVNLSTSPVPCQHAEPKLGCLLEQSKPLESSRLVSQAQQQDLNRLQSSTPPFKDYINTVPTYSSFLQNTVLPPLTNTAESNFSNPTTTTGDLYSNTSYRQDSKFSLNRFSGQNYNQGLQGTSNEATKFQQQYSSSTDEGCETDMEDIASMPSGVQNRLSSYASSSSSSGVVTFFNNKSLSQNLSCDSSQSNFSTFESLDYQLSDCSSELASSLPSCTSTEDKLSYESSSLVNTSPMHPCVYISSYNNKNSGQGLLTRHNPLNYQNTNKNCPRAINRSPVDFREGRRASDGLVAQQASSNSNEQQKNSLAFNSQRLNENCKAKGVLELHLVQKEAQKLKTQYQATIPVEEMTQRQLQHNQFAASFSSHYLDTKSPTPKRISLPESFNYSSTSPPMPASPKMVAQLQDQSDLSHASTISQVNKPPLQQQLMQHRLFQQKRQLLQKQMTPANVSHEIGALHSLQIGLSRRQMLRQQSYKIAQQQQILPPLPLTETENRDLLAFQAIVEGPNRSPKHKIDECSEDLSKIAYQGSMEISITNKDRLGNENWSNLPSSLQNACQISELAGRREVRETREPDTEGAIAAAGEAPLWPAHWPAAIFQPQPCFQVFQQIN